MGFVRQYKVGSTIELKNGSEIISLRVYKIGGTRNNRKARLSITGTSDISDLCLSERGGDVTFHDHIIVGIVTKPEVSRQSIPIFCHAPEYYIIRYKIN
ncbi:MAG: hypothetical protein ABIG93_00515 [archaeon]|nr:hypothetical protein [Nanoarchaeota archaeon]